MNWSEWFLAIAGVLLIVVLLTVIVAMAIEKVSGMFDRIHKPSYNLGHTEGREQVINNLRADAWWFSEDKPTMEAIQSLASGRNVSSVREEWRNARKNAPAEQELR